MTMKRFFAGCVLACLAAGCASVDDKKEAEQPSITVSKTTGIITLDGKLDEKAWQSTPAFELQYADKTAAMAPREAAMVRKDKFEGARARLLYDDKYLYVGVELDDDDVLDFVKEDQYFCYRNADTFELFLSPVNGHHYWEIYSTPKANKSGFFFPSGGTFSMDEMLKFSTIMNGLDVASHIQGTLNGGSDKDKGWTTELRISRAELASKGIEFAPGQQWRILLARYNYSRFLYKFQNSFYPVLPAVDFHLRSYYAPVEFK
jgi:hypothetical protein